MSRLVSGLVFLTIACGILFGLHWYIWARLVRDLSLPSPWRGIATGTLIALGVSMPLMFPLSRALTPAQARFIAWPVYIWMGVLMFLFLSLLLGDLAKLALWASVARGGPADPARRQLIARALGGAAAVLAGGLSAIALREGLRAAQVTNVTLAIPKLPRAHDGFTIVQLTDIHVGPTIGREWLEHVVARTNALAPDLIAITGDLVDGSVEHLRELVAPLANLKAKHGVYFVTGNHEYYSGADEWLAELGRLGVRCLRNERVPIADAFELAGIDDHSSRGFAPGHGADLPGALAGRDASRACVLLAHQPRAIHEAARLGVDVQLSGHTHGGQIWPWNYLVKLQQPYIAGLAREGDTHLYVSRGTGYWGPPMRLRAPAEIARITLRSAA